MEQGPFPFGTQVKVAHAFLALFALLSFVWIFQTLHYGAIRGGTYTSGEASRRRISLMGVETQYHFSAYTPGLYLGIAGGVTSIEPEQTFFPDFEDLYFGPKLGYTHYFTPELSIGADLKFLYVMSGPSYVWLQALTGVRFHF